MKHFLLSFLMASFLCNGLFAMEGDAILVEPIQYQQTAASITIIDATGKKFILLPKHHKQALSCLTILNMIKDTDDKSNIVLHLGSPLATYANLEFLFNLMTGDIQIKQLSKEEIIMLFELADFLEANIIATELSSKVYDLIKDLPNDEKKDRLLLLVDIHSPSYQSCDQFIDMCSNSIIESLFDGNTGVFSLNFENIHKKIKSLNGINRFTNYIDTEQVVTLNICNQDISDFNIADLVAVFPKLHTINLSGNKITRITKAQLLQMPVKCNLNLNNNPINSIESGCFNQFSRFKECVISLYGSGLNADQEREAFGNDAIQNRLNPAGWRMGIIMIPVFSVASFPVLSLSTIISAGLSRNFNHMNTLRAGGLVLGVGIFCYCVSVLRAWPYAVSVVQNHSYSFHIRIETDNGNYNYPTFARLLLTW